MILSSFAINQEPLTYTAPHRYWTGYSYPEYTSKVTGEGVYSGWASLVIGRSTMNIIGKRARKATSKLPFDKGSFRCVF